VKQFDEEHMLLENKKTDKAKELSTMLHKSIEKVDAIRVKQNEDMGQFEEAETTAIEDKRKRLHYESIRIEEIKKEDFETACGEGIAEFTRLIDKSKTGVTQWMGLGNNKMNLVQSDNQLLLNNVVVGLIDTMNAVVVTLNGK
jgi:hypothetical protein